MKNKKERNVYWFAFLVTIGTFLGAYGWMFLVHFAVQMYEIKKLGSLEAGKAAAELIFGQSTGFSFVAYVGMEICLLLVGYLMVKKQEGGQLGLEHIGMKKGKYSTKQFLGGFGLAAVMYGVAMVAAVIFGLTTFKGYGFDSHSIGKLIGTLLIIGVGTAFPGFCEEIVFRGIIQNYLMKKVSVPVALVLTSACFSLMHIGRYSDLTTLIYILFPSVVFGYLFVKTKSLYLSIGMHYGWDFCCSVMGWGNSTFNTSYVWLFENNKSGEIMYEVIVCLVFLIVLVGTWCCYRKNKA